MIRRRVRNKDTEEELNIDLTPMLDVVFIMLIFFIVTATFTKESSIEIDRPQASSSTIKPKDKNFILYIKSDKSLFYNDNKISPELVTVFAKNVLDDNINATAILYSDKSIDTGYLISIMDKIRIGGISNIAVSTEL